MIFVDQNGDGTIDADDKTMIGNPHPDFTYGFNASANYKAFDFSLFLQGTHGNDVLNGVFRYDLNTTNLPVAALERWTGEGTSDLYPRISHSDPNQNNRISDRFVEDGSFLRIKNVQLGYTLPESVMQRLQIGKCRIYVAASNLFTFTSYSGLDPEIGTRGTLRSASTVDSIRRREPSWLVLTSTSNQHTYETTENTLFDWIPRCLFGSVQTGIPRHHPLVGSTEANYYLTPEDAEAATIACYNNLQQEVTNIQGSAQLAAHFRWYFGDICSDDSFKEAQVMGMSPTCFCLKTSRVIRQAAFCSVNGKWRTAALRTATCVEQRSQYRDGPY